MHAGLSPTPQTENRAAVPTSLILQSGQSPGDIVMMTVPVVEIQRQYPGRYRIDVRTSVRAIWEHNPFITPIRDGDPSARVLAMNYELIHVSNRRPVSFLEGFCEDLAQKLGLPSLRPHEFHGHIFLSEEERSWMNQVQDETGYEGRFWLVNA
ncbi:MAG TPA: hypothetical protein VGX78_07655, partial [Pirellulales bacterium]|nr:hypothetical protein [Pirellulales bacterium]